MEIFSRSPNKISGKRRTASMESVSHRRVIPALGIKEMAETAC